MKNDILIKNALVWSEGRLLKDRLIFISEGKIKKIGAPGSIKEKVSKIIDAAGKIVLPGFINSHMHFYSTFARGIYNIKPSTNFNQVLENLWWKLDKKLTDEANYYSALFPLINAIRKGTTTFIDHQASPFAIRGSLSKIEKAVRDTGLRACLCYEVSDRDGYEKAQEGIEENIDFIERAQNKKDNFIKALFGLHAQFTISDKTLEKASHYGKELNCGFHIHCAEAKSDQINCQKNHKMSVVKRLKKFNILGNKTILAHCVHISEKEMDLIKESQSAVVHNPQSNANNSVGIADIVKMSNKGILLGLGTDAMTVNMLEELRSGLWLQHLKNNPSMGFVEISKALMENNAKIANRYFEKIGIIKEGFCADIILIDYYPPTPIETENFYGHLIFGISQSEVDTTIVNGKILMENKKLKIGIDERELSKESIKLSRSIWKKL